MTKRQIRTDSVREPMGHFSQAIETDARGKLVFISGMTARRADGTIAGIGDIEAQTRQVCENIKAAVEAAGGTWTTSAASTSTYATSSTSTRSTRCGASTSYPRRPPRP